MRERNLERANSDNVWDSKTPTSTKQRILHATTVVTDRVSAERNAIGRVRPSVCLFPLEAFEPTDLTYDHSSQETENQGKRLRSAVRVSGWSDLDFGWRAVCSASQYRE